MPKSVGFFIVTAINLHCLVVIKGHAEKNLTLLATGLLSIWDFLSQPGIKGLKTLKV